MLPPEILLKKKQKQKQKNKVILLESNGISFGGPTELFENMIDPLPLEKCTYGYTYRK